MTGAKDDVRVGNCRTAARRDGALFVVEIPNHLCLLPINREKPGVFSSRECKILLGGRCRAGRRINRYVPNFPARFDIDNVKRRIATGDKSMAVGDRNTAPDFVGGLQFPDLLAGGAIQGV